MPGEASGLRLGEGWDLGGGLGGVLQVMTGVEERGGGLGAMGCSEQCSSYLGAPPGKGACVSG